VSESKRLQRAFLDDALQSLQAPLHLIQHQLEGLLGLPVVRGEGSFIADLQRIGEACASLEASLRVLASDEVEEAALSRLRHDLRNGIGIVDGYCDILLEDSDDQEMVPLLQELRRQSRAFQARLESLSFAEVGSGEADPIAEIFRSFKRGLTRNEWNGETATILVADDNDSGRELIAQQLQRQGFLVIEADGGQSCLETMRRVGPDLLLLDLVMPDMNGYEVLQVIRADEQLRRIPVVVISGIQDEQGAIHCIDAGASDYLIKPVNATLLNARLAALLERKRWQDREREYLAELEKSQRFIRKIFGRYLSDEIVRRLLDEQDGLELGGERRKVTVLMADIRDFSSISRQLEPEQCLTLLNNYLGVMAEVIQRFKGTVDELMGDGILAIFGAPVSDSDDCDRALACAVAMQLAVAEVNRLNGEQNLPAISMGIGLNTGDVVVGNIGSEQRTKYGIVGHNVNLTARVEGCSVGGQILAAPSTIAAANLEVLTGRQVKVAVKGMDEDLSLCEVLGVGLPYDLVLPERIHAFLPLESPHQIELRLLNGKQLADKRLPAMADAVDGDDLRVVIAESLDVPVDVAVYGLGEDRCYGRLFALLEGAYRLTITSHDKTLQDLLAHS
jgi:adenylate cyclase